MDPRSDLAPWFLKLAFVSARARVLFGMLFVVAFVGSWFVDGKAIDVAALLSLFGFLALTPAKWVMRLNEQARQVRA